MLPLITFLHMLIASIFVAAFAIDPAPMAFEVTIIVALVASAVGHIVAFRR